jgi:hypothetical protein
VIANLAVNVNGGYCGNHTPNETNTFPASYDIDYIRIWQKTPQAGLSDLCSFNIQGSDGICAGQQLTYNIIGQLSASMTWSVSPNLAIISQTNSSIIVKPLTNSSTGGAWIKVQASEPCSQSSNTKNIWIGVPAYPQFSIQSFPCEGTVDICVTNNCQDCEYTWSSPEGGKFTDGNCVTIGKFHHIYNKPRIVTFSVKIKNSCGEINVNKNYLSPGCQAFGGGIIISPNPANQTVNITLDEGITENIIQYFTVTSQNTGIQQTLQWNGQELNLNVSSFADGLYNISLRLVDIEEVFNSQFLVQH